MGGSAQNTLQSCIRLAERNYRIVLVCGLSHESNMTASESAAVAKKISIARKKGVKVIFLKPLVRRISPLFDTMAFFGLLQIVYREKPDLIHTHSSKAGVLGRLAALILRVSVVVHTPHGHVFYGHFSKPLSYTFLVIERIFDKITDCTIALTDGERNDYIKNSVSRYNKLIKIHSGVDIDKFIMQSENDIDFRKIFSLRPEDLVVGTVGWLLPIKGPSHLLEAMQMVWPNHPAAKLIYVGKGELEKELRDRVDALGVKDRVLFLGWRSDIADIMRLFDIFALPSLNEGMGRVIVEAMASGKPVVASNTGGIPDLVINGKTGYLVEPRDVNGFAEAINDLLEEPSLRRSMGDAGQQRSHLFSEDLMIKKIDTLYQELLT